MAGFNLGGITRAVIAPALIALVAYAALSYLILPFVRRYRQRYSQYIPVNGSLSSLSEGAASLHHRFGDRLMSLLLPSAGSWRNRSVLDGPAHTRGSEEVMFNDEEGEDMVGFEIDDRRRAALEERRSGGARLEYARLSRDLEEGFKDDSDEESEANAYS